MDTVAAMGINMGINMGIVMDTDTRLQLKRKANNE